MLIESLIVDLSHDPFNPELNFKCAMEYKKQNQTASAVSFYLRTAEYGEGVLVYNSLLKVAQCFDDQKDRVNTVSNCILQALAYMPERPEAYFLMAQFHERLGNWQECYTWAMLGLEAITPSQPLEDAVGYYGDYCLEFERAVAAWWIGRKDESESIFNELLSRDIAPEYRSAIEFNLSRLTNAAV